MPCAFPTPRKELTMPLQSRLFHALNPHLEDIVVYSHGRLRPGEFANEKIAHTFHA